MEIRYFTLVKRLSDSPQRVTENLYASAVYRSWKVDPTSGPVGAWTPGRCWRRAAVRGGWRWSRQWRRAGCLRRLTWPASSGPSCLEGLAWEGEPV